ncbi:MAG: amidase [Alkalispirochaeta sp.]
MKRYYPSQEEKDLLHRMEEQLGIRPNSGHQPGVTRMTISAWRELWRSDPSTWMREIRDRPRRFDPDRWSRGVVRWWNQTPTSALPSCEEDTSDTAEAGSGSGTPLEKTAPENEPLWGVPVVVKDLFDVTGEETRCGSAVLGAGRAERKLRTAPTPGEGEASASTGQTPATEGPPVGPAKRDAWLVALLREYGASVQGRAAMNEFAYGIDGRNRVTGDCPHPLDPTRISGGSSSGSAWAVAAGVVPLALGSDTGGSIRVPAALNGIYGYRLPWSAERLSGTFPLSPRMDTVGWFVSCVEDARLMLELTAPNAGSASAGDEITIAAIVPPDVTLGADVQHRWHEALEALAAAEGVSLVESEAPAILGQDAWNAYHVIGSSDAAAVHADWLDRYQELYDPVVWSLIDRGRRWSSARVSEAESVRDEVAAVLHDLLETYDVLVMPVTPLASPTFELADGSFREAVLRLNAPVSLAGLGALTVPLLHSATRSSGIQVVVSSGREQLLRDLITRIAL